MNPLHKYKIEKTTLPVTRYKECKPEVKWFVILSEYDEKTNGWNEIDVERTFDTHQDAVTYLVNKQWSSTDLMEYAHYAAQKGSDNV